ncbi:MAG: hypothetical protein OXE76_10520, partial [Alphaproteobacteria bacterium]|nr:hypothetical protein [Alphaproteobacteria bacterium]
RLTARAHNLNRNPKMGQWVLNRRLWYQRPGPRDLGAQDGAAIAAVWPPTSWSCAAFVDPDPYGQFTYASRLDALRGISDMLHLPLARLAEDDLAFVNELVGRTLEKAVIRQAVMGRFPRGSADARKETPRC